MRYYETTELTPVVAAVPTYNMATEVAGLLPQLLEQGYDKVFVLDDGSTEESATELQELVSGKVELIKSNLNVGTAATRNKIIPELKARAMGPETIINFCDADMEIQPHDAPVAETAKRLMRQHRAAGMIGSVVLNPDKTWSAFNYGPLVSAKYFAGVPFLARLEQLTKVDLESATEFYKKYYALLNDSPNPAEIPEAREVGWLAEGFHFIRAGELDAAGGYDSKMRYLEALDIAAKLESRGLKRVFDPSITVRHLQVDVRGSARTKEIAGGITRYTRNYLGGKYKRKSGN